MTHWSRSVTFTYRNETLEQCTRQVALNVPGVWITTTGKELVLHVPDQERAVVKPTSNAHEGRLVIDGHSSSVSRLGPPSEKAVNEALQQLHDEFAKWCDSA